MNILSAIRFAKVMRACELNVEAALSTALLETKKASSTTEGTKTLSDISTGAAILMLGDKAGAEKNLQKLDKICWLGCSELDDLRTAIRNYKP